MSAESSNDRLEVDRGDLAGQVAIVTGAGRGIGHALAQALSRAGASVAVVARSASQVDETAALINAGGGRALPFAVDVTDQQAVEQMVAAVEAQWGPVDILINNAGVARPPGPIWEVDADEWWRCQEINVRGAFLCSRSVVPSMIGRQRGYIINMSSGAGYRPDPYVSAYRLSKASLTFFTEALDVEVHPYHVAAFAVSPGLIRTAMTDDTYHSDWTKWTTGIPEGFAQGEGISTEQIERLVMWILSGAADRLSGRHIHVRDDYLDMLRRADEIVEKDLYVVRQMKLSS